MKSFYYILIFLAVFCCGIGCTKTDDSLPETPIFDNVELIETSTPFNFALSNDVAYAVIGIFTSEIETEGNTITSIPVAGNHTGLDGWTRSSVLPSKLWTYNSTTNDFTESSSYSLPVSYRWAVWGFDKWGNLTHASADIPVP